jgi:hypothetical protein
MLNPSDADAAKDDPTVLNLVKFARRWSFGGLHIVNQYAFRSPLPAVLWQQDHLRRVGPLNQSTWVDALCYALDNGGWVLAAWGNGGSNFGPFVTLAEMLGVELRCLGTTQNGSPKHPLARGTHRISDDQQPIPWVSP